MSTAYGDCIVSNRYDDNRNIIGLWIEHADPRVLISPELLEAIADERDNLGFWPHATLDGDVLRIRGINRTVIYRITGRVLNGDNWRDPCIIGEWPD